MNINTDNDNNNDANKDDADKEEEDVEEEDDDALSTASSQMQSPQQVTVSNSNRLADSMDMDESLNSLSEHFTHHICCIRSRRLRAGRAGVSGGGGRPLLLLVLLLRCRVVAGVPGDAPAGSMPLLSVAEEAEELLLLLIFKTSSTFVVSWW